MEENVHFWISVVGLLSAIFSFAISGYLFFGVRGRARLAARVFSVTYATLGAMQLATLMFSLSSLFDWYENLLLWQVVALRLIIFLVPDLGHVWALRRMGIFKRD